jgi:Uma2 family endonuclease
MNWQEICSHPALRDLPFKLETDRWGHIVMSPASNRHSRLQSLIARLLDRAMTGGEAFVECSVATPEGIKVADVAWASADFLRRHGDADPYSETPEIVVEVLSPSNTQAEMEEKKMLYFDRGAKEVWICSDNGAMIFNDAVKRLEHSVLAPTFPTRIQLAF